jgi:hypothetical protein
MAAAISGCSSGQAITVACVLGEGFALDALRNAHKSLVGPDSFLNCILSDMVKSGYRGGVETGFISTISRLAVAGYSSTPRVAL